MIAAIADTHAAIWYVFGDPRLSVDAKNFFERSAVRSSKVGVSTITVAEAVYLSEKGRVPAATVPLLLGMLRSREGVLQELPLTGEIVEAMQHVGRDRVPDLPDRLIAATALHFNVPVITRDREIQRAGLQTVW